MRNILLTAAVLGVSGLGLTLATPAHALMTQDQAAAEGFVQPASPLAATQTLASPANPDNGLAQRRMAQPPQYVPQQSAPQQ